eukprot:gene4072-4319_t
MDSFSNRAMPGNSTLEEVLHLVLRHSDISKAAKDICCLLGISKTFADAIASHCSGQLVVEYAADTLEAAERFAPWLSRYGCLIGTLELGLAEEAMDSDYDSDAEGITPALGAVPGAAAIAATLASACSHAAAAAGLATLKLHTLRVTGAGAAALLQQLPAQNLTTLRLLGDSDATASATAAAALAGLPGLQELYTDSEASKVLPAISTHSSLRRIRLSGWLNVSLLRHLPGCLQELDMDVLNPAAVDQWPGLQLQQCTVLTRFSVCHMCPLSSKDQLPAALQECYVNDCLTVEPLIRLKQLRVLELDRARAQPSLPMTLQHLGRATSLTSLTLGAAPKEWSTVAGDVAAALQQLTQLQRLIITFGIFSSGGDAGSREQRQAVQARMATLMAAIAGLPRLRSLQLHQLPCSFAGEAAQQLGLATQLTELQMLGNLSSSALLSMIESLPQLQSLTICSNPECSNKVVGVIARNLQQLTMLDLSLCGAVTDVGVRRLSSLQRLQHVGLDGTKAT